ncbi:MAG: hypothetical protein ACHQYQ_10555 [Bacteriovoracales bacterium]
MKYDLIYKEILSEGEKIARPYGIKIGEKNILFPCSIGTGSDRKTPRILEVQDLIIVNFSSFTLEESQEMKRLGVDMSRNIWAFDLQGNKVWEISPAAKIGERSYSYNSLWIKEKNKTGDIWSNIKDGTVIVGTSFGADYILDVSNGHVELIKGQRAW